MPQTHMGAGTIYHRKYHRHRVDSEEQVFALGMVQLHRSGDLSFVP